ncbi:MAG: nucleotidyltransferase family protein [Sphingobacterium sp.]|uniref:nucleotidyltransferase family protein n=1 Tax=Sphingobacterium sp. JB170 TaxID=1434842 RepID=UPI00097EC5AE|nr:sugar phosphate nucleotidyltransferase [Sphingobacterium sp. JB170]SJN47336.1 Glutamate synthase [NADPH] large chain [Sphingobacterium sp. JB170]
MNKPTLVILAAGLASRYGSAKQVDGFGPNGERIIDYSIFDAIKAGFGKVVFVIREEYQEVMKDLFEDKLRGKIELAYAFQDFDLTKFGIDKVIERQKPWGTAHAVMSAAEHIDGPFCVINADDFYGYDAFKKMADFLTTEVSDKKMALVGFRVGNTLSDFGYVSRGVCQVDENGHMLSVTERTNIYRGKDGQIVYKEDEQEYPLEDATPVSMNFWGFHPIVLDVAKAGFPNFVAQNQDNPKAEYFIPSIPDNMVHDGTADFKLIPTDAQWFGVTYPEDKPYVMAQLAKLVEQGAYPQALFSAE